jgi:NADPH-dependent curcumin reductase CurA
VNSRYWTLAKRPPPPWPDEATFALKEAPVPTPGPGQALTRTIYVSLDPYQWGYKRRGEEPEGAPCHARSVSQVTESRIEGLAAGDFVFNTNGWAEYGLMGEGVRGPAI